LNSAPHLVSRNLCRLCALMVALVSVSVLGQTRKQIDSLNALAYDVRINQASTLSKLYVDYAQSAQKQGYKKGEADSYANAALLAYYRGKYEQAIDYRLKSIRIYESIDALESLASEYGELGFMMKRRDMKKAQYYMRKGMRIGEEGNFSFPLAAIYDNYGVLKEMQDQLDSALMFYQKSLEVKTAINDSVGIPYSLSNIAGIHVIRKQFAQAAPYYNRVVAMRAGRQDIVGLSETYGNMAWMYKGSGQDQMAIEYYQKAIDHARQAGYIHMAVMFYKDLAEVYERNAQTQQAFDAFKNYSTYKDSVINKETNERLAELEVEFDTEHKEKLILQREAEVRERNMLLVGVSVLAIFVGLVGYLIYRQQKLRYRQMKQEHELKSAIVQIENQNKLQEQRLAISRDLHDNIGSQLTFIISSVENIKYAFAIKNHQLEGKLDSISSFARDTIVELRDTIWAMNHSAITFDDLRGRILNFMEKARVSHPETNFEVSITPELDSLQLSSVEGMNVYRTLQEAVNNALKYSGASQISIDAARTADSYTVTVRDNGSGFDVSGQPSGNGLRNMKKRMDDIGAQFTIDSTPEGTLVRLVKFIDVQA
jgi:signal transduction histidine kinase